jgi:excisionase family DNA binding protein
VTRRFAARQFSHKSLSNAITFQNALTNRGEMELSPMATDTASTDFISLHELAESWLVSYEHVRNLVLRGVLPAHRIGQRIIISREDAADYLRRARTVAPENESQQPIAA